MYFVALKLSPRAVVLYNIELLQSRQPSCLIFHSQQVTFAQNANNHYLAPKVSL